MTGESPRSSRLTSLMLVVISVVLTLGLAELVLREFLPVRGMIYELHERYLFRHVPGSRKLAHPAGLDWPKVLVKINAEGRRGDERSLFRAIHRVVVYGDSFISAEGTAEAATYVAQLETLLSARFGATKVLNAGVTGYGVDQESLRIEDEIAGLKPDLVVVAVFAGNDFGDLLRDKLYRLDTNGQIERNMPILGEALREDFLASAGLSRIQIVRAVQVAYRQWRSPQTAHTLEPTASAGSASVLLPHRIAEYNSYVLDGDNVVRNLLADEYDADVSLEPESASARYRVLLMDRVVNRIHDIVVRHGAHLLLLIIPESCDVTERCDASRLRRSYSGYRPAGLTSALEAIAQRQGLVFLNLFEPFRQHVDDELYYRFDQHWSPAGQLLAARLSTRVIADAGLIGSNK
jgi:hypothetical protein